jgi:predicted Zn-dependent protease
MGRRHASASTNRTDASSLESLVDRAIQMMKLAPEDPEWMPVLGAQSFARVSAAWDEESAHLSSDARARAVRASIDLCEKSGVVGAGFHQSAHRRELLCSSAGFSGAHAWTNVSYTMTARTPDAAGSGWAGGHETRAADLDADAIARRAIDKAVRSQKPRALEPGRYTVVLEPDAVGDLLSFLIEALGAREADEGRSFFSKRKIGDKLFGGEVTLKSDPTDPATPASPFDEDGVPLEPITWIDKGVLRALSYTRYWASKQNTKPTGTHAAYHLLGGSAEDTSALVKKVDKGLLVTRFWYTRWVDPRTLLVTGLTRDGIFWIERGEIAYPVNNFRFNESPAKMLSTCTGLTKTTRRVPSGYDVLRVPALVAHDFEMASVSAAV